jgi:hypothetical protein
MLYRVHLVWAGFELTTLVVIGTDCIGKFNYHTITTAPKILKYNKKWRVQLYCSLIETPSATYYIFSCQIMIMFISVIIIYISCIWEFWGPLWSYGSWIYLCNQCLSPLTLWVRIPLRRGIWNQNLKFVEIRTMWMKNEKIV